jgi:hypothetical protein
MNDSELNQLLRSAGTSPPVPGDFQRSVWRRIEARETGEQLLPRVGGRTNFRWASLAAMAATIVLGAWLGFQSRPDGDQAKAEYVRSISPFVQR